MKLLAVLLLFVVVPSAYAQTVPITYYAYVYYAGPPYATIGITLLDAYNKPIDDTYYAQNLLTYDSDRGVAAVSTTLAASIQVRVCWEGLSSECMQWSAQLQSNPFVLRVVYGQYFAVIKITKAT